eukprot:CAMPEP_0185729542 /NCGR_PEP_ID=MMETSP1171-20130828/6313_1 /TAXON_ID=374046 /ORGANISM="Helicotheca tamensis, Strain CCMP826" /LENGTH=336 /DNA_ID=CAMNT_0028398413 /DNA_START=46 /DNA_END=1056 /DNA_ORIENTATION=-
MTPPLTGATRRRFWAGAFLSGTVVLLINVISNDLRTSMHNSVSYNLSPLMTGQLPNKYVRKLSKIDEQLDNNDEPRPFMYTFVDHLRDANSERLGTWKEAWHAAGWQPRVLTLEDAERHALYNERDLGLRGDGMRLGDAEVFGFHRYLAMSNVGGGWMSEWDVFPLNPPKEGGHLTSLPNQGRFTVYEQLSDSKGVVPSLSSGTAKEYNRMARLLYENAIEQGEVQKTWSDLNALGDLYKKDPGSFEIENAVIPGRSVLTGVPSHLVLDIQNWGKSDCLSTDGMLAVHFTPVILEGRLFYENDTKLKLPQTALIWLDAWAEKCTDIVPFEESRQYE